MVGSDITNGDDPAYVDPAGLSAVELLSSALQDAMDAYRTGLIVGPGVDEVALRRAMRRALSADVARLLQAPGQGPGKVVK